MEELRTELTEARLYASDEAKGKRGSAARLAAGG